MAKTKAQWNFNMDLAPSHQNLWVAHASGVVFIDHKYTQHKGGHYWETSNIEPMAWIAIETPEHPLAQDA